VFLPALNSPAATNALDGDAVNLSVPPWVANRANADMTSHGFYFATVEVGGRC
jgi:hypothetical protein